MKTRIEKKIAREKRSRAENKRTGRGCPTCGDGTAEYTKTCMTCGWENDGRWNRKGNADREARYLSIAACGKA